MISFLKLYLWKLDNVWWRHWSPQNFKESGKPFWKLRCL